jgi:hypothetical protein
MAITKSTLDELAAKPGSMVSVPLDDLYGLSRSEYQSLQLAALKTRFGQLRDKIPALKKLADSLDIQEITTLEAAAPLMFQHVIYKSYPLALIERSDFVRLTSWLNGLTTHDLSHLDVSRIEFIDDWLQYLDDNTPLRVVHSTGTSGKLSFLPRSTSEMPAYVNGLMRFYTGFRNEPDLTPRGISMVIPAYRRGFNAGPRIVQAMKQELRVAEEDCISLYDFVSADLMSLAGRLRAAEAKGEVGKISMNEKMQVLRERLITQKANEKDAFKNLAKSQGISHVFGKTSIVHTGGGMKGGNLPDDFMKTICDFIGVESVREAYGMTETMCFMGKCPEGYYHVPPQMIPYLTNPDTGELLPQTGVQNGRFGFIDLLTETYWGGFLTGDSLTLDWDMQCKCGRSGGPSIHGTIERLSEKRGGDDKISCAGGADDAHDKAVKFLLEEQA